jgi:DNA invertase Pin-like site-specific DNA recombinase
MLFGYARVSTNDQHCFGQKDALMVAGVHRANLYTDVASGAREDRPGLEDLLRVIQTGDTLIVTKLDRLGRSLKHLIQTVELLEKKGVAFRSLSEGFDTNTSGGKLIFSIFGAIAEFERSLIQERTHAGLRAARARGRVGGRPKVMDAKKIVRAKELYDQNVLTPAEIAKTVGVSRSTLYRALNLTSKGTPIKAEEVVLFL